MKKRAMIIAMMAAMLTVASDCTVKLLHAEETQTKEAQAEDSQSEGTSQLPIKALSPKVVEENPYMPKSDSNIHHDCYNTDSTDEVLPVGIYSEINVSYEKVNANASPAIFLIPTVTQWFHFLVDLLFVISMQMRHRQWDIFPRSCMTKAAM